LASGVDTYGLRGGDRYSANASHERCALRAGVADANRIRLPDHAIATDIDIVTAVGEIDTGAKTHRNIVAAGCVVDKRVTTDTRVLVAGRDLSECQPWPYC
jgi:hypothetical protein